MNQLNAESTSVLASRKNQIESHDDNFNDIWDEDDDLFGDDNDLSDSFALNMEWKRRHNEFHTMGYRDGISAGKEDSVQKGFNHGYNESVYSGYNWGLIRGISSSASVLSDQLKEKLISNFQIKDGFWKLYESAHAISSDDAFQIFKNRLHRSGSGDSHSVGEDSSCNQLDALSVGLNDLFKSVELSKVDLGKIKEGFSLWR